MQFNVEMFDAECASDVGVRLTCISKYIHRRTALTFVIASKLQVNHPEDRVFVLVIILWLLIDVLAQYVGAPCLLHYNLGETEFPRLQPRIVGTNRTQSSSPIHNRVTSG